MRRKQLAVFGLLFLLSLAPATYAGSRKVSFPIRGVEQTLYVLTPDSPKVDRPAVVVVSGDGGWHSFIVEIAQYLADHGYAAVGVDAKAYLESFSTRKALEPAQVISDFAAIARFAKEQGGAKSVVLTGWSEGAGLALLGGLDPTVRAELRGVVAIGLPELNELAWRWSDAVIYVTHKVPNEPTFNSKDYIGKLSPIPLMVIQSTRDEFVPVEVAQAIFARAQEPKQITFIEAGGHHFEGQRPAFWQALDRAFAWFEETAAKVKD